MKIDLSQPAPRVKTLEEAQTLIDGLWALLQEQTKRFEEIIAAQAKQIEWQAKRIAELEEKLNTNSKNSSKPPSSDRNKPKSKRTGNGRKAGGQPGHEGKARALLPVEEINEVRECRPVEHCECGSRVRIVGLARRHQVVEVPPVLPVVTEYRLYEGECIRCKRHYAGALPAGVTSHVTGPRLLALIGTLTGGYRLSKRLAQGLLQDLFRIDLSVGTISQSEELLSEALAPIAQEAHAHVQQAPVVHADETGHKEKGKLQWMWIAIAGVVSVFLAQTQRNTQKARELLGACFAGILVSDRLGSYNWVDTARRQLCWAHLLRDFTKISERSGAAGRIGEELVAHTKRLFKAWHRVRDGTLSECVYDIQMGFLRHQIHMTLERGSRCRDAKTARTCQHILKSKQALWTFTHTPGVEPTNNLAERTIRHYVIWRKTNFGTQSVRGSRYMERIMTVVGSCKLQGRNVLDFISQAVLAQRSMGKRPSLV